MIIVFRLKRCLRTDTVIGRKEEALLHCEGLRRRGITLESANLVTKNNKRFNISSDNERTNGNLTLSVVL
jgi:hypothetical protein